MADENKLAENGRDENGKFVPGHEGLPGAGRPTGSISITAMVKKRLEEVPFGQRTTYAEQMVEMMLDQAIVQKDTNIAKEIWHYIDGMPKSTVSIDVDKENLAALTSFFRTAATPTHDGAGTQPASA